MNKNMKIKEFPIQTVYENQVSTLPPIRYCLEVIINSIVFAFFKKIVKIFNIVTIKFSCIPAKT